MHILLLLSFSILLAQDAWFLIRGDQDNPFWADYSHGIQSACKNHQTTCRIHYSSHDQFIDQAKTLQKAMRSDPKGISISTSEAQQLISLLKQANSDQYPLIVSTLGLKIYRDLKLKNYVGPNLNELRALITDQLQAPDFNNIIISTFASSDHDHVRFIQSLVAGHPHADIITANDLSHALLRNNTAPITLVTFGTRSALIASDLLKRHPHWKVKWIQVDGPSEHSPLATKQITTQPFVQGYKSALLIIYSDKKQQEILIKPRSLT